MPASVWCAAMAYTTDEHYTIRCADADDVSRLVELSKAWADEGVTRGQAPDRREWFHSSLGPYSLVAETGSSVVGYVQGEERMSDEQHSAVLTPGTPYLEVTNLYVAPRFRSQGVGGALLDRLLGVAADRGVERSLVYSATKDLDRILSFYRSHGFQGWFVQLYR
jgi:ribosomal protein S18 acetylase RimI-like enzyme